MKSVLSPVDANALTGELAEWMASSTRDGLAAGDQGAGELLTVRRLIRRSAAAADDDCPQRQMRTSLSRVG
jgi:hypothetical protein